MRVVWSTDLPGPRECTHTALVAWEGKVAETVSTRRAAGDKTRVRRGPIPGRVSFTATEETALRGPALLRRVWARRAAVLTWPFAPRVVDGAPPASVGQSKPGHREGDTCRRLLHVEDVVHHQLVAHSITVLRVAVGAVFLGFGVLKYLPGVSPAEGLVKATTHLLFLGVVPGEVSVVATSTLECFIGISLIANRWMRLTVWLLAGELVGVLSPLALLPGRLFAGPHHAPTLEGQYVLKDVILVAAGMVIAAATFRGGRLVRGDLPPTSPVAEGAPLDGEQKLRLVLDGASDPRLIGELSERHGISESKLHDWQEVARKGAALALAEHEADT